MAKLNSILGALSGRIGGMVFGVGRFGQFVRQKVTPVNPRSAGQVRSRGYFDYASWAWGNVLSEAQRIAWRAYAAATPVTDVFGNTIYWTGHQMFIRVNSLSQLAEVPFLEDAPASGGFVPAPSSGIVYGACTLYDNAGAHPNTLLIDADALADVTGWNDELDNDTLLFSISTLPLPAGWATFDRPFTYIYSLIGNSVTPPSGAIYVTIPWDIVNGTRWYVRYRRLYLDGRTSGFYGFTKYAEAE